MYTTRLALLLIVMVSMIGCKEKNPPPSIIK